MTPEIQKLVDEAKKKYPLGTHFKCVNDNKHKEKSVIENLDNYKPMINNDGSLYGIHYYNYWLLLKGKWADVTYAPEPEIINDYPIY